MKSIRLLVFILVIGLGSCSTGFKNSISSSQGDLETVVLMGTNDLHGALAPMSLKTRETKEIEPIPYQAGGSAYLASEARILRSEFGEHFLWLDAGDEFQGTLDSNLEKGAPVVSFFNQAGLDVATLGNHEFDFGPATSQDTDPQGALKARLKEARFPYVSANIVEKKTGELISFPNTSPHILLRAGKLKVGVIGLTTLQTPFATRAEYVREFLFTDLKTTTLHEAEALRKEGAQVIILLAHVGLKCELGKMPPDHTLRTPTDPQGECGDEDEMVKLLRALPPGTVDAVISGHSHQIVHHWVAGVPVIQGGSSGRYFNLIYLTYDWEQKKILPELGRIEGPIPVCPTVFQNQEDCNGERLAPSKGRGPLVVPMLHGKKVQEDSKTTSLLQPIFERLAPLKKRIIGKAARPIEHTRTQESALGNLVTDAMREKTNSNFALANPGGLRAPFEEGPITYEALFRTLPFDNSITVLTITGKELKNILRVAQSGSRGFFPVSGLKLSLIDLNYEAPSSDLNGNGKIEPWEINRLKNVWLSDGSPIHDSKTYTLAVPDFLVTGGDDLGWPMSQIAPEKIKWAGSGLMRDAVETYISQHSPLNTLEDPLIDPENPRLKLERPKKAKRIRSKKW